MGIRHAKFAPNEYVIVAKKGKVIKQGVGLSFFYDSMSTNMTVIPTAAFDAAFTFDDITTSDFQRINVQGEISYIVSEYEKTARLVDFTYVNSKDYENKLNEAKQTIARRVTNITKIIISKFFSDKDVRMAIKSQDELARVLSEELMKNTTIGEFGISVMSVSVLGVSPQLETKKALEAATREEILQQQDDAIYKRRNASIEQERIVKENELNTEIKVAEKEREKQEKAIAAQMSIQEKTAKANMQKLEDDAKFIEAQDTTNKERKLRKTRDELETVLATHKANEEEWTDSIKWRRAKQEALKEEAVLRFETEKEEAKIDKQKAEAKAYANEVILKAFESVDKEILLAILLSGMDSKTLIAKAFGDLAENAGKIGSLNISPDLLETLTRSEV